MGNVYTGSFESVTVTATGDLWELATTSSTRIRLLGWEITSSSIVAENLEIKLVRAATPGSGGTAMDENPIDPRDSAATAVGLVKNSTPAATLTDLQHFNWEQLGPLGMRYDEKTGYIVNVSTATV